MPRTGEFRTVFGRGLVETLDLDALTTAAAELPPHAAVIGLGGGQAVDVAKFFAWTGQVPLFQVPTAMTVNAPFGHRAGLRSGDRVRYLGYAVPEAVYVDFDVIQQAPAALNRSGIGDLLCYHTAHHDWRLARDLGRCEPRWPYDERLVAAARERLGAVLDRLDDIRDVTEDGIRPEAMGVTWDDVAEALKTLGRYVREAGLWFTVADVRPVDDEFVARVRAGVEARYGR